MKKTILFIGPHRLVYELLADALEVRPIIVETEEEAIAVQEASHLNGIVSGYIGRSEAWFSFLAETSIPSVVYSSLAPKDFSYDVPVIEKGFGSADLSALRGALGL